jgi:hypothetical protein
MEQELICNKCKNFVGVIDADGVALRIGAATFFCEVRFSHDCGRAIRFKPNEPKDLSSIKGYTQELLINLGKDKKIRSN